MQIALPMFFLAYVALALWRERIPGQQELFPFASWSLFSIVPNTVEDFSLRILEVDGRPVARPLFFEESRAFFRASSDHGAQVAIEMLGRALSSGQTRAAEAMRRTLEEHYLSEARDLRYELVARSYDPMERWRTGSFTRLRSLGSYRMERP